MRCNEPVNRTFTKGAGLLSLISWINSRACWIVGHTLSCVSSLLLPIFSHISLCMTQRSNCKLFKAPLKFSKIISFGFYFVIQVVSKTELKLTTFAVLTVAIRDVC